MSDGSTQCAIDMDHYTCALLRGDVFFNVTCRDTSDERRALLDLPTRLPVQREGWGLCTSGVQLCQVTLHSKVT